MEQALEKTGLKNLNWTHYYNNVLKIRNKIKPVFLIIVESQAEYNTIRDIINNTDKKIYIISSEPISDQLNNGNILFCHKDNLLEPDLDKIYQECDYLYCNDNPSIFLPAFLSGVKYLKDIKSFKKALSCGICQDKYNRINNFECAKKVFDTKA